MEEVLRKVEDVLKHIWTSLTKESVLVVKILCQITLTERNCMMVALKGRKTFCWGLQTWGERRPEVVKESCGRWGERSCHRGEQEQRSAQGRLLDF